VYNADDAFTKKYNVEEALLDGGIGELEALTKSGEKDRHFSPGWSSLLVEMLNTFQVDQSSKVTAAYWTVSNATIQGLLVRVRTALADLVAELVTLMPGDRVVPDKGAVDAPVQFVITGDHNTINYSPQHAADGGTNTVTIGALAAGPVTGSGAHSTAIGSQTAGDISSVVGSQAVHGNHNTVTGQDTTTGAVGNQERKHENWWTRLRKRSVLVAFFTVGGGIAVQAGHQLLPYPDITQLGELTSVAHLQRISGIRRPTQR